MKFLIMINFSLDKNLISGVGWADVNDGGQTHSYGVEALLIWKRTAGVGTKFSVHHNSLALR